MKQKYRACDLIDWYNSVVTYPVNGYHLAQEDDAWVYLFFNPVSKLYKIGKTKNLHRRRAQIQSISGCVTEIVIAFSPQSNCDESIELIESLLHRFFWDRRKKGEWFDLSTRDVFAIGGLFWKIEGEDIEDRIKEHFQFLSKNTHQATA